MRPDVRTTRLRVLSGTVAAQVAGFALASGQTVLTARLLGAEGRGRLATAMLLGGTLALLLAAGAQPSTTYHVAAGRLRPRQALRFGSSVAMAATLVSAAVVLPLWATGALGEVVPGLDVGLVLAALVLVPTTIANQSTRAVLHGQQRIGRVNALQITEPTLVLVASIVALALLGMDETAVAWIAVASTGIAATLALVWLGRGNRTPEPLDSAEQRRSLLQYGSRAHVATAAQFLNYRLDVLIVNAFLGPAAVGVYTVSVRLAEMLFFVPDAIGIVLFPRAAAHGGGRVPTRLLPATATLSVLLGGVLALTGNWLIPFVFSDEFADAFQPLLWLLPGAFALAMAKVLTNHIAGLGHPEENRRAALVGLVVTVALDLVLIPRFGLAGAAAATSASYVSILLVASVAYRRFTRSPSPSPG